VLSLFRRAVRIPDAFGHAAAPPAGIRDFRRLMPVSPTTATVTVLLGYVSGGCGYSRQFTADFRDGGQNEKSGRAAGKSALPPRTDIPANGRLAPEAVVPTRSALQAKRTWHGRRFERLSIIALACAGWPAIPARRSSELVRAADYFSLVSGFVIARTLSMKTCVARLRDRFFSVMIATLRRVLGNSTGRTLSDGCLRGSKTQ